MLSDFHYYDSARQQKWLVPIIYDDDDLIACNKPPNLPVIPERWHPEWPCLRRIVSERLQAPIYVVHRIDAGTSGLVLFGKTAAAHRELCRQFAQHQIEKVYWALVKGEIREEAVAIAHPLVSNPHRLGEMMVARQGKPAITHIRVLERFRSATLVEAKPQTGRQHQIRVHLQAIGHPLLVDAIYGQTEAFFLSSIKTRFHHKEGEPEHPLMGRLTLHAQAVQFRHPRRDELMMLTATEPKDFQAVVKNLRKYAGK